VGFIRDAPGRLGDPSSFERLPPPHPPHPDPTSIFLEHPPPPTPPPTTWRPRSSLKSRNLLLWPFFRKSPFHRRFSPPASNLSSTLRQLFSSVPLRGKKRSHILRETGGEGMRTLWSLPPPCRHTTQRIMSDRSSPLDGIDLPPTLRKRCPPLSARERVYLRRKVLPSPVSFSIKRKHRHEGEQTLHTLPAGNSSSTPHSRGRRAELQRTKKRFSPRVPNSRTSPSSPIRKTPTRKRKLQSFPLMSEGEKMWHVISVPCSHLFT